MSDEACPHLYLTYRPMYQNQKVVIVMPAHNAAKTLRKTHAEVLAQGIVDLIVVVDDKSHDETVAIALTLPKTRVHLHERNLATAATRKPATKPPCRKGPTLSS